MKKLLILCVGLLVGHIPAMAQATQPLTYVAVVEVPGASQADLYRRAVKWLSGVPQLSEPTVRDAASGLVASRESAAFTASAGMACTLWRRVSIEVKDGRARYEFTGFQVQYYVASPAVTAAPSRAQATLHPIEELTAMGGAWGRSMQAAADEATAAQVATLKAALLTGSDW